MPIVSSPTAGFPESLRLKQFSTGDYLQLIEAGVLGPEDKIELIGGIVVDRSPASIPHNHCRIQVLHAFAPLVGRFDIAIQGTLTVSEGHVYDPDFMLLQPRPDGFKTKLPDASDVHLLIEAADSSLARDRKVKMPIYASADIPEYWIADLEHEALIIHRDPQPGGYRQIETRSGDETVSPLAAPEFSFAVRKAFD